jgi:hypothetical protein
VVAVESSCRLFLRRHENSSSGLGRISNFELARTPEVISLRALWELEAAIDTSLLHFHEYAHGKVVKNNTISGGVGFKK